MERFTPYSLKSKEKSSEINVKFPINFFLNENYNRCYELFPLVFNFLLSNNVISFNLKTIEPFKSMLTRSEQLIASINRSVIYKNHNKVMSTFSLLTFTFEFTNSDCHLRFDFFDNGNPELNHYPKIKQFSFSDNNFFNMLEKLEESPLDAHQQIELYNSLNYEEHLQFFQIYFDINENIELFDLQTTFFNYFYDAKNNLLSCTTFIDTYSSNNFPDEVQEKEIEIEEQKINDLLLFAYQFTKTIIETNNYESEKLDDFIQNILNAL